MIRVALLSLALGSLTALAQDKEPTLAVAKAQFAKADRDLNDTWMEVKKKLPAVRFNVLKATQRDWIVFRNERAEIAGRDGQPEKAKAQNFPAYFITATRLTEDRTSRLRRLAHSEDEGLTGRWIDGRGGWLDIVEQKDRLLFDFHVVRGHTHDLGALAGIASWNRNLGWFSDKGQDKDDSGETNIVFIALDLQLEIISANARYYLGRHAYFGGIYFKAASLDAQEEAATVRAAEAGNSPAP